MLILLFIKASTFLHGIFMSLTCTQAMLYVCVCLLLYSKRGGVGSFEHPDQDTAAYD